MGAELFRKWVREKQEDKNEPTEDGLLKESNDRARQEERRTQAAQRKIEHNPPS
jgi:hypothetical protein